jgi:3-deoxy-D-manno-octulosonate 8-phosphate phosphatase (KDO 8-P phosphatase)
VSAEELHERARHIRLLVLDVDGVLTDGTLYFSAVGEELKTFNIQDGLGIKMLRDAGVEVAIITGRRHLAVERRAENIGVSRVLQGIDDKLAALLQLTGELALSPESVACVGDDLPDVPLLRRCGLAVSVPQAPARVRQVAHYVTQAGGGRGAVREVCELILEAQGNLETQLKAYFR